MRMTVSVELSVNSSVVAVRLRLGYEVSRNIAPRRTALDHHRLLQVRRQFLATATADDGERPAGRLEDTMILMGCVG